MKIFSQPSLTNNGNTYTRTRKASVGAAMLAGSVAAATNIHDIVTTASETTKGQKALAIGATALSTLLFAGLGKLFGGIFDNQKNNYEAQQADIKAEINKKIEDEDEIEIIPETIESLDNNNSEDDADADSIDEEIEDTEADIPEDEDTPIEDIEDIDKEDRYGNTQSYNGKESFF